MLTRLSRFGPVVPRLLSRPPARFVSQSKTTAAAGSPAVTGPQPAAGHAGPGEVSQFVKNPDFHGFSSDPVVDMWNMRVAFFFGISLTIVIGSTLAYFYPNQGTRKWARREAERLVQQREKEGLPLIAENYYDPNSIILPSAGEE
ncbi:NADH dehydrogenase [ubiquinone] 1 beta subcomplex subunit 11, mitochondrial [Trachinotus anak]|uniref:NADH dehydrogenase [ubiquinone] 1 beta subcomplex subunit 11, mitochondrial n=1 Tax=Trachinotus anak TaxID=443729 RepID=UPI0039F16BD7